MGCGGSKASSPPPAPAAQAVDAQPIEQVAPAAGSPTPHKAGGKGGGKGKRGKPQKWQIQLEGKWKDYENQEDCILKRAYMMGQQNCKFHLRDQHYEYNFKKMVQKNLSSKKERKIRAPKGPGPPKKPLLPAGPMTVITVGTGQPGTMIDLADPNNKGQKIKVFVPAHAKPGQKMAVPIPQKGQSVEDVQKMQVEHDAKNGTKSSSWSTGGKVAAGGAAVGGLALVGVGGVILGDHLAGGEMATTIGEGAIEIGEAVADGATDAVDAIGAEAPGIAEDVGDWFAGAGEDAVEWLGDAGEDIGDFVMDLF